MFIAYTTHYRLMNTKSGLQLISRPTSISLPSCLVGRHSGVSKVLQTQCQIQSVCSSPICSLFHWFYFSDTITRYQSNSKKLSYLPYQALKCVCLKLLPNSSPSIFILSLPIIIQSTIFVHIATRNTQFSNVCFRTLFMCFSSASNSLHLYQFFAWVHQTFLESWS